MHAVRSGKKGLRGKGINGGRTAAIDPEPEPDPEPKLEPAPEPEPKPDPEPEPEY